MAEPIEPKTEVLDEYEQLEEAFDPHPRFTKIEKTGKFLLNLFANPKEQDKALGPFKKLFFDEDE